MKNQDTKKLKITQIRSTIGCLENQKRTMQALGIRKMNHSVVHQATPQIMGMIDRVRHLVRVEDAK